MSPTILFDNAVENQDVGNGKTGWWSHLGRRLIEGAKWFDAADFTGDGVLDILIRREGGREALLLRGRRPS